MSLRPTRRQLLVWASSIGMGRILPGCSDDDTPNPAATSFFTDQERTAIGVLANAVLPPGDTSPGAKAMGAAAYIEKLCTALDGAAPLVFAGGPYSNRNPFATPAGAPSNDFPPNDFANFLPLDRVAELAWKIKLFGSKNVPGGDLNAGIVDEVVGIRVALKTGIAAAIHDAPKPMAELTQDEIVAVFKDADGTFQDLFIDLVQESAFSPPEYGGNIGLAGWKMCRFEGDRLPLGFSIFATTTNTYVELPGEAVSVSDGPDPSPMDDDTLNLIRSVIQFLGGEEVKP